MTMINILIVDDKEANIIALQALLNRDDIRIFSTTSPNEALKIAWANNISIALLDVQMPEMDGFELAGMLKSNSKTKDVLIIFVTAISKEPKYAIKGFGAGAMDYLYKPLDPYITAAKVDAFIQLARSQQEIKNKNQALENFAVVVNNSADIICTVDALSMRIKTINPAVGKILGYRAEEWVNRNVTDMAFEEDQDEFSLKINEVVNKNLGFAVFDLRFKKFDKQEIWMECRATFQNKTIFLNINDITSQKSYQTELLKSKRLAENAKKIKETFLAHMSHELRTPINGVIGLVNLLKNTPLDEEQLKIMDLMDISSQSLLGVINDVLDISKMEAGKFRITRADTNINLVVKAVVDLMKVKANEKDITLMLEISPDMPKIILADSLRINQILMNLLSNAIKFTDKGFVKLSVKVLSSIDEKVQLQFSVEDTGIGIPKESLSKIFDSFEQAEEDTTRKYGGTGLGLSIVKKLIELKGGELLVRSEFGKGSTFDFTNWFTLNSKPGQAYSHQPTRKPLKRFEDIRVLVAEDNMINQFLLSKMLKSWNLEVDMVENGQQVIEKLSQQHYDLILMDTHMPVMNGYDAAKAIRLNFQEPTRSIPIISLSASSFDSDKQQALNSGMNAILSKPFMPEELHQKIEEILPLV